MVNNKSNDSDRKKNEPVRVGLIPQQRFYIAKKRKK